MGANTSPNVVTVALLQQEKSHLICEIVKLQETVGQLELQKGKLRKGKKKLRAQLEQVKTQLMERTIMENKNDQNSNYLTMAINDLRSKLVDMKESSSN